MTAAVDVFQGKSIKLREPRVLAFLRIKSHSYEALSFLCVVYL